MSSQDHFLNNLESFAERFSRLCDSCYRNPKEHLNGGVPLHSIGEKGACDEFAKLGFENYDYISNEGSQCYVLWNDLDSGDSMKAPDLQDPANMVVIACRGTQVKGINGSISAMWKDFKTNMRMFPSENTLGGNKSGPSKKAGAIALKRQANSMDPTGMTGGYFYGLRKGKSLGTATQDIYLGKVHSGFEHYARVLWEGIRNRLSKEGDPKRDFLYKRPIYVTGHSLGAPIANLLAECLLAVRLHDPRFGLVSKDDLKACGKDLFVQNKGKGPERFCGGTEKELAALAENANSPAGAKLASLCASNPGLVLDVRGVMTFGTPRTGGSTFVNRLYDIAFANGVRKNGAAGKCGQAEMSISDLDACRKWFRQGRAIRDYPRGGAALSLATTVIPVGQIYSGTGGAGGEQAMQPGKTKIELNKEAKSEAFQASQGSSKVTNKHPFRILYWVDRSDPVASLPPAWFFNYRHAGLYYWIPWNNKVRCGKEVCGLSGWWNKLRPLRLGTLFALDSRLMIPIAMATAYSSFKDHDSLNYADRITKDKKNGDRFTKGNSHFPPKERVVYAASHVEGKASGTTAADVTVTIKTA